jgi:hypothetical protein
MLESCDLHVAPAIFAQMFSFHYFANFWRDHSHVAFNPTFIFDCSELSLSSCNEKQFGVLGQTVDLLARAEESGRRDPNNPHIEVILQYHKKHLGRNKFKYGHTDNKWFDVDCIISIVATCEL